ncbi:MAG TPA: hypothetical protein VFN57_13465 [Thermomicrobiaceae bacterium]|nr:hypothetical protein [Thermomicrobiaceae bacterium]
MNPLVYSIPIAALLFDAYCLLDLYQTGEVRYFPPLWWLFIIAFLTPVGGVAYLIYGKVR